jgi:putative transposase
MRPTRSDRHVAPFRTGWLHSPTVVVSHATSRATGASRCDWGDRCRSGLVDNERCVLTVIRCIELDPARAMMIAVPWEYAWSSVQFHLGPNGDPSLTTHPALLAPGRDPKASAAMHRRWLMEPQSAKELISTRRHTIQQPAPGEPRLQAMIT